MGNMSHQTSSWLKTLGIKVYQGKQRAVLKYIRDANSFTAALDQLTVRIRRSSWEHPFACYVHPLRATVRSLFLRARIDWEPQSALDAKFQFSPTRALHFLSLAAGERASVCPKRTLTLHLDFFHTMQLYGNRSKSSGAES